MIKPIDGTCFSYDTRNDRFYLLPSVKDIKQENNESYSHYIKRIDQVMNKRKSIIYGYIIAYVIIAFLTFGWYYNHVTKLDLSQDHYSYSVSIFNGLFAATFWPIYQGGRFAIFVTQ